MRGGRSAHVGSESAERRLHRRARLQPPVARRCARRSGIPQERASGVARDGLDVLVVGGLICVKLGPTGSLRQAVLDGV